MITLYFRVVTTTFEVRHIFALGKGELTDKLTTHMIYSDGMGA